MLHIKGGRVMKSKVKFIILCPDCGKTVKGKSVMLGQITQCKCGYIFTEEDKQIGLERVRRLRKLEKQERE